MSQTNSHVTSLPLSRSLKERGVEQAGRECYWVDLIGIPELVCLTNYAFEGMAEERRAAALTLWELVVELGLDKPCDLRLQTVAADSGITPESLGRMLLERLKA